MTSEAVGKFHDLERSCSVEIADMLGELDDAFDLSRFKPYEGEVVYPKKLVSPRSLNTM